VLLAYRGHDIVNVFADTTGTPATLITRKRRGGAPMFVLNQWYVVASSDEIGRTPLHRMVCEENLVLFRRACSLTTASHGGRRSGETKGGEERVRGRIRPR
jgi:hypothetical protein